MSGTLKSILKSRKFHLALSLLVSAGFLTWFARQVDWADVWFEVSQASWLYFIPVTLLFVGQLLVRGWRWQYLLGSPETLRFRDYLDGIILGTFGNFVLPLRAGEFIRPLVVKRSGNLGYTTAFVSVVVERILDLSAVLVVFSTLVVSLPGIPPEIKSGAAILGVIAVTLCVCLFVAAAFPGLIERISELLMPIIPRGLRPLKRKVVQDVLEGARVLRCPKNVFGALFGTGLVWFVTYLQIYISFMVVGIYTEFWHAIALSVIMGLAIAAPSAPGFLGVFQFAVMATFMVCGLDQSKGGAFALLMHLHQYIIIIGWGILVGLKRGMALRDFEVDAQVDQDTGSTEGNGAPSNGVGAPGV